MLTMAPNASAGLLHSPHPGAVRAYWAVTAGVLVMAVWTGVFYAPVDESMGLVQKLIYLHIPSAAAAVCGAAAAFAGNLAYLWSRSRVWHTMATNSARVTVFCSVLVLASGMVWGKFYWGTWWTWSPRLTFTLILGCLYAAMLLMHSVLRPFSRRAMVCAVYGAVAFLDVPLVYLSVRLLPDVHPTSLPLTPEMRHTLIVWFVLAGLVCGGLIAAPIIRHIGRYKDHAHHAGARSAGA